MGLIHVEYFHEFDYEPLAHHVVARSIWVVCFQMSRNLRIRGRLIVCTFCEVGFDRIFQLRIPAWSGEGVMDLEILPWLRHNKWRHFCFLIVDCQTEGSPNQSEICIYHRFSLSKPKNSESCRLAAVSTHVSVGNTDEPLSLVKSNRCFFLKSLIAYSHILYSHISQ